MILSPPSSSLFEQYYSKINLFANKLLKEDNLLYTEIDENSAEGKEYLEAIKEETLDSLGYFLKPSELIIFHIFPIYFFNH